METSTQLPQTSSALPVVAPGEVIGSLYQIAQQVESPRAMFREALPLIARSVSSPFACLEINHLAATYQEEYSDQPSQAGFWRKITGPNLTTTMREFQASARVFQRHGSSSGITLLGVPVQSPTASGGICVVLPLSDPAEAQEALVRLTDWAMLLGTLVRVIEESAAEPIDQSHDEATQRASRFQDLTEFAYTLTNRLRTREGFDLVAFGRVQQNTAEILCVSGMDEVPTKGPNARALHAAMEECLDFGSVVVHRLPVDFECDREVAEGKVHGQWSAASGAAQVLSIPLATDGKVEAVLSVRRSVSRPFTSQEILDLIDLVEPYASTIHMLERAGRNLWRHLRDSWKVVWTTGFAREYVRTKLAVLGILGLLAWAFLGTMSYDISVPCRLAPKHTRQVSVPLNGRLVQSDHKQGSRVHAGDLLCRFDSTAKQLEERSVLSELAIAELDLARALAESRPAEIKLAEATMSQLQASLGLIRHRIENSKIKAPAAGVIVSEDLARRLGDVFTKGESLLVLATSDEWLLEVDIAEDLIADVREGMSGSFSTFARPELNHSFDLGLIEYSAQPKDGSNVFVGEAKVEVNADWIRPGMAGVARVEVGERRPWWIAVHRIKRWLWQWWL
jgi:hypothetical protein